jgi:FkbM family methyltransferase
MKILYGADDNMTDVTAKYPFSEYVSIPPSDHARAAISGDPIKGVLKHILIEDDYNVIRKLDHSQSIILYKDESGKFNLSYVDKRYMKNIPPTEMLSYLHSRLSLKHGLFSQEYPEQLMAATYIKPSDKVLEIGGNIGRNSLIIASLLDDSQNLVVVESDPSSVQKLMQNRNDNNLSFHIVPAAISRQQLIQSGWNTRPSDIVPSGWYRVNTNTYAEICASTGIQFNVLVADCEGALYYILHEEPNFFDGMNLVIMENDYRELTHKQYVDERMKAAGFKRIYVAPLGYPAMICHEYFFEVWAKDDRAE